MTTDGGRNAMEATDGGGRLGGAVPRGRTTVSGQQRLAGLVQMLQADPSRTWQEVFISGDVRSGGLTCVGTLVRGMVVTLVFRDVSGSLHLAVTNDDVALGYPIAAAVTLRSTARWHDETTSSARVREHLGAIEASADAIEAAFGTAPSSLRVLVRGHANFAHVALSVSTAVERALSFADATGVRLSGARLGERHPLGMPADLYPELDGAPDVRRLSRDIGGGFRASDDALVPLAIGVANKKPLMRVSGPVRERLRGFVPRDDGAATDGAATDGVDAGVAERVRLGRHDTTLWVSLRGLGRRALPMLEMIDLAENLASVLASSAERPAIVLDGTSLQFGDDSRTTMAGFSIEQHLAVERMMAGLIASRISRVAPSCTIYPAIGLRLSESFQLASQVDAYVVHDGTTQHKIGWLRPELPGLVHGPRQRNVGQGFVWHPVDHGTPAVYFPQEWIVDHKPADARIPHANYGYSLVFGEQLQSFLTAFVQGIGGADPNRALYEKFYAS